MPNLPSRSGLGRPPWASRVAAALALGSSCGGVEFNADAFSLAVLPDRARAKTKLCRSVNGTGRQVPSWKQVTAAASLRGSAVLTAGAVLALRARRAKASDVEEPVVPEQQAATDTEAVQTVIEEALEQQIDVVEHLQNKEVIVDDLSMALALRVLRLKGLHEEVLMLFSEFEEQFTDQGEAYAERMASAESREQFSLLYASIREMREREVRPTVPCYNTMLRLHASNKSWRSAVAMLANMAEETVPPNLVSFDNALACCPTRRQWELITQILDQMEEASVAPNLSCYRSALHTLSYSPSHDNACIQLYYEMRTNGIVPDEDTLRYLLRACFGSEDQDKDLNKALKVFRAIEEDAGVELTQVHFDIAIGMCERAARWRDVLSLASSMGGRSGRSVIPHSVTCNAVLKACVELGKWEVALKLLGTMDKDGTELDSIAYGTVMSACARAEQWDEVLRLYADVEQRLPELLTSDMALNAVTALCQSDKQPEALKLYRSAVGSRPRGGPRKRGDPLLLDARGQSPQVASIIVRCALEDIAQQSAEATPIKAVAGLQPAGPKDVLVAVEMDDLTSRGDITSTSKGSAAEGARQAALDVLGGDAEVECCIEPFPCIRILGTSLPVAEQVQQAVAG